jgi:hypothetical protein
MLTAESRHMSYDGLEGGSCCVRPCIVAPAEYNRSQLLMLLALLKAQHTVENR